MVEEPAGIIAVVVMAVKSEPEVAEPPIEKVTVALSPLPKDSGFVRLVCDTQYEETRVVPQLRSHSHLRLKLE